MRFCQTVVKALTSTRPLSTAAANEDYNVFVISRESDVGIFWKRDIFAVNGDQLDQRCEHVPDYA